MKEYKVKVTMANSGIIEVKAETDEEAKDKAREMIACGKTDDTFMDDFEYEKYEIVSSKPINEYRIKLIQTYLASNDCTIIWELIYKGDEMERERIVGYYHGYPTKEDLEAYAYKGVEGIIDDDSIYDNVENY